MANPSLQIGNSNWAIKEDNLLGYSTAGTRFVPQPITMTRASAGTRVNSSGLVETVELLGSEEVVNGDFELNSNWNNFGTPTTSEQSTEQSHTGTYSWKVIADATQEGIFSPNNFSITNGNSYSVSLWIYSVSGDSIKSGLNNTNVSVFTERTVIAGQWTNITYEATATSTGASYISILSQNSLNFYIDNVSVKESTKNNLARVDYDGTASLLLVEPQRTNLVTDSIDVDSYFTSQVDVTFTNDYGTSPTGDNNSTRVQWADSTSFAYKTVSISTDTSASIFVKGTSGETVMFGFGANITTGTVYTFDGSWQRITFTGSTGTQIFLSSYGGSTATDFQAFGLQLEAGSYPTSYIPTDGSTVTRVQDQYSKTGISNLINSEEGVLFAEIAALSDDLSYRILSLSNGTSNERIYNQYTNVSNTIAVVVKEDGNTQANMSYVLSDETSFAKVAIKWKVNDFALWVNGFERDTDTLGNTPVGLNRLALDNGNSITGGNKIFGKVKQLQVFKTALTDPELVTLTTI